MHESQEKHKKERKSVNIFFQKIGRQKIFVYFFLSQDTFQHKMYLSVYTSDSQPFRVRAAPTNNIELKLPVFTNYPDLAFIDIDL